MSIELLYVDQQLCLTDVFKVMRNVHKGWQRKRWNTKMTIKNIYSFFSTQKQTMNKIKYASKQKCEQVI